jgi:phage gp46-like protein
MLNSITTYPSPVDSMRSRLRSAQSTLQTLAREKAAHIAALKAIDTAEERLGEVIKETRAVLDVLEPKAEPQQFVLGAPVSSS